MSEIKKAIGNLVLINIVSAEPKKLADFYENVLGADITRCELHGYPQRIEMWFAPRSDNTVCIVANEDKEFKPQTYNACQGFEFRVADADTEYERICTIGIEVKEPPKDLPYGYRFFHIKDPDGNGIDIVQELKCT